MGIAVCELAKLQMLKFYYDFLGMYVNRRDFELIQVDTDSMYMALDTKNIDEVILPEMMKEFQAQRQEWLSKKTWSNHIPGLFNLEFEASRVIAVCSNCYYVDDGAGHSSKASAKGMCKKHNDIT